MLESLTAKSAFRSSAESHFQHDVSTADQQHEHRCLAKSVYRYVAVLTSIQLSVHGLKYPTKARVEL